MRNKIVRTTPSQHPVLFLSGAMPVARHGLCQAECECVEATACHVCFAVCAGPHAAGLHTIARRGLHTSSSPLSAQTQPQQRQPPAAAGQMPAGPAKGSDVPRINIGVFGVMNAGKSTLMNAITRQETSIVDATPGTTAGRHVADGHGHPAAGFMVHQVVVGGCWRLVHRRTCHNTGYALQPRHATDSAIRPTQPTASCTKCFPGLSTSIRCAHIYTTCDCCHKPCLCDHLTVAHRS